MHKLLETKDTNSIFKGSLGGTFPLDVKDVSEEGEFEGYASVFGVEDQGGDIVRAGAFSDSLTRWPAPRIKLLWHHNPQEVIGKFLEAREDSKGLFVKGKLFLKNRRGSEVHELVKEEAVEGLSIGYRTREFEIDRDNGTRTLVKVDLREISVVTFPMLDVAGITMVKGDGVLPSEREFERMLTRDAGFSVKQAKAIIANGYRSLTETARDAGEEESDFKGLNEAFSNALQLMRGETPTK